MQDVLLIDRVFFVEVRRTYEDTWMDSKYMGKHIPVMYAGHLGGMVWLKPYCEGPMCVFRLPFNAVIDVRDVKPSTEEKAMKYYMDKTGNHPPSIDKYDPDFDPRTIEGAVWFADAGKTNA